MKKRMHPLKRDYKKLVAALKAKSMCGVYCVGMNNPYHSALFFAAETAIEPMRKASLGERLDVYRDSGRLHSTRCYA